MPNRSELVLFLAWTTPNHVRLHQNIQWHQIAINDQYISSHGAYNITISNTFVITASVAGVLEWAIATKLAAINQSINKRPAIERNSGLSPVAG